MNNRPQRQPRDSYAHFSSTSTRWNDNDVYGHMNNVVYFELFDSAINTFLIEKKLLDIDKSTNIGLVVDNKCTYFSSVKFPDALDVGIRTSNIGRTSVTYEIGIFSKTEEMTAAMGTFTHVYVDRKTNIPSPLSEEMRHALESLQIIPR